MTKSDFKVRAIRRGLEVLQSVNRHGSARLIEIANETTIPYPTVCRIVDTLVDIQMLEREEDRPYYRPTALVQTLSGGYQEDDALVKAARKPIADLCEDIGWPITIATRVGSKMTVRDSTHRQTTLTYNNYFPGYTLPLLHCSVGKAYLAFCAPDERRNIGLSINKWEGDDPETRLFLKDEDTYLKPYKDLGYAYHTYNAYTKNPGKTSSLSVPIFVDGTLKAALGLVYFSSAMNTQEAAQKYLEKMQATAAAVGQTDLLHFAADGEQRG